MYADVRIKILKIYRKKWSAIEKKLNAKKTQISKYKFKTNLMIAKLKNNISTTEEASLKPAEVIKDLKFKKRKTKTEYDKLGCPRKIQKDFNPSGSHLGHSDHE